MMVVHAYKAISMCVNQLCYDPFSNFVQFHVNNGGGDGGDSGDENGGNFMEIFMKRISLDVRI